MWLKEHKKQVLIAVIAVFAVAVALVCGILIGKGKKTTPVSDIGTQSETEQKSEDTTEQA